MKQLIKTTLLLLALLLPALAMAHDFEVDGIYYKINGNEATVTFRGYNCSSFYNEYSGPVVIPAAVTYNGTTYPVTSIGDAAFYTCTGLTNIDIPNSVTSIGSNAFNTCTGLTNIDIPNSVTSIGSDAFYTCTGLMSVKMPNCITSIVGSTFSNCRKLKSITIPYPVTSIGGSAFYYCEDLTDVTCLAVTPPSMGNYNTIYPAYYMATLHVPEKSVEAYKATDWWNCFINIVGDASEDSNTPNAPVTDKCDTNDDGEVNIADVNQIIDAILGH